jgi:hypothetical protein
MPGAADTFQQIAGSQPGPFSKYLQPTQPGPMDQPMNAPTGWESKGVAGGEIALGFLKGVRAQRVQQFAQQEAVKQGKYDAFLNQIDSHLQGDELDDVAKRKLAQYRADVQAQHFQSETKGVSKGGVGEFFKNLIVNATGGPMQGSKPLNHDESMANVEMLTQAPESKRSYWRALADTQMAAAIQPGMSAEEVQRKAMEISGKLNLQSHLGDEAYKWVQQQSYGHPSGGSLAYIMQDNPTSAPPPGAAPSAMSNAQTPPPPSGGIPAAAMPYLNMVMPSSQPPPGAVAGTTSQAPPTLAQTPPAAPSAAASKIQPGQVVTTRDGRKIIVKSVLQDGSIEY